VGSRYIRSVAREMKKRFENSPKRKIYVLNGYIAWLKFSTTSFRAGLKD